MPLRLTRTSKLRFHNMLSLSLPALSVQFILPIALVLFTCLPVLADNILLKNGNEIRGKIITKSKKFIIIEVPYGRMSIDRRQIKSIEEESKGEYLRRTGQRLSQLKDFDEAISFLRKAVEEEPDSTLVKESLQTALLKISAKHSRQKNYERSKQLLIEAKNLKLNSPLVERALEQLEIVKKRRLDLQLLAQESWETQDLISAHERYSELMLSYPEQRANYRAHYAILSLQIGHMQFEDQEYATARKHYLECLKNEPNWIQQVEFPLAYCTVQIVLPDMRSQNFVRPRGILERSLQSLPDEPSLLYFLGLCYEGSGQQQKAKQLYAKLTKDKQADQHLADLRNKARKHLESKSKLRLKPTRVASTSSVKKPNKSWEGKRFTIVHADKEYAGKAKELLEFHFKRLSKLWFKQNSIPGQEQSIRVYLHPTHASFVSSASPPAWSTGITKMESTAGVITTQEIHLDTSSPQALSSTLPHELCHVFLKYLISRNKEIPLWIEEGVATNQEPAFKHSYYKQLVKDARRSGQLFSLTSFTKAGEYPHEDQAALFYAQSYSLVKFLFAQLGQKGAIDFFKQWVLRGPKAAFESTKKFNSISHLERKWLKSLR